jgi:hypothetical protein
MFHAYGSHSQVSGRNSVMTRKLQSKLLNHHILINQSQSTKKFNHIDIQEKETRANIIANNITNTILLNIGLKKLKKVG